MIQSINQHNTGIPSYEVKQNLEIKETTATTDETKVVNFWSVRDLIDGEWRLNDGANGKPPIFGIGNCGGLLLLSHDDLAGEIRELDKSITETLARFHSGDASQAEVEDLFEFAYETMVRIHIEVGVMDQADDPAEYKSRILQNVLERFQYENGRGAMSASEKEGSCMGGTKEAGKWVYYNAKFHYQEEDMFNFLKSFAGEFAENQGLTDPVTLIPPDSSFFTLQQYNQFVGRFFEKFDPPRDLWYFKDLIGGNSEISLSGATIDMDDILGTNEEQAKEKLSQLGVEAKYLMLLRIIDMYLQNGNSKEWFDISNSVDFTKFNQHSQAKGAYEAYSVYAHHGK